MKIRTVFSKTDWLGVKNTAVTCGTYQFNNGKKKQLWGIILYIRLIQKIEIFLEKWKIIVICLFLKRILKNSPGQILGNKAKQTTLSFQPVQNIIYNKMKLRSETGNVGRLPERHAPRKKFAGFVRDQLISNIIFIFKIEVKVPFATPAFSTISEMVVLASPLVVKRVQRQCCTEHFSSFFYLTPVFPCQFLLSLCLSDIL